MRPLRLNEIQPGENVNVVGIRGGCPHLRRRLIEMGIVRGTPLRVQRIAPLGDPMEVKLECYNLSLRMREAHHIVVERKDSI